MRKAKIWAQDMRSGDVVYNADWQPHFRVVSGAEIRHGVVVVNVVGVGDYTGTQVRRYGVTSQPNIRVMIT